MFLACLICGYHKHYFISNFNLFLITKPYLLKVSEAFDYSL